jgi:hypothetical protein
MLSDPAHACHRFSFWAYKTAQRCGVTAARHVTSRHVTLVTAPQDEPDIALPGLARADLDGGEADEATRAHALLRAALEAANAH